MMRRLLLIGLALIAVSWSGWALTEQIAAIMYDGNLE